MSPEARARAWPRLLLVLAAQWLALGALLALAGEVRAQGTVQAAAPATAPVPEWGGRVDLQTRLKDVRIEPRGSSWVVVLAGPRGPEELALEEFGERLHLAQTELASSGWIYKLLNITTPWGMWWVCIGFLGQALFTFRMLLQWWTSEKHKRSVVPVAFWWGSLFGGMMLFVYFIWRKDIVGIVGQSTGVFVYARNLVLIYRHPPPAQSQGATAGSPG